MDYGGRNGKQGSCACFRLFCSELWEELDRDSKREEELEQKLPPKQENTALIKLDQSITRPRTPTGTPTS